MVKKIKNFLFHNTTARQTIAKNTFWLAIAHFGGRMLRSIIIIYAARVLGAPEWGIFSYAITLVAFLTLFVDMGISNILTRETARTADPQKQDEVFSTSLVLKVILVIFGACVVLFVAPLITNIEGAKALFPIIVWILIFDSLREFGFAYLRAREKMQWEAGLSLGMNLVIVGLGFLFLAKATTVTSFTYAYAIGTGIGFLATLILLRENFKATWNNFRPKLIYHIMRSAWPFAISGVLGMLTLNTDVIIIGWMRSAPELGYYSAAQRFIQLLYLLPTIISISALPMFARMARIDDIKFRHIFERIVSVMFLVAIPIVIGGIIVAEPLLSFVFGSSYAPATMSLQILLLTLLFDFPAVVISSAVFAYDQQKSLIFYAAIGGFSNVILDIMLISRFGIEGSAGATVIAQLASNIYLWHIMKQTNNFMILKHLKKVIMSAFIMGITTYILMMLHMHVVTTIIFSGIVYVGCLYFSREKLLLEIRTILQPVALNAPEGSESAASIIQEETHKRIESD